MPAPPSLRLSSTALIVLAASGCFRQKGLGEMVVSDANNYSFTVGVDFGEIEMTEGTDGTVDWSGVTTDMRGNTIESPADIELVRLVSLTLDQADVETAVAAGTLTQEYIRTPWEFVNSDGASSCSLSDFQVTGNYFDPGSPDQGLGFYIPDGVTTSWIASLWANNPKLGAYEILSTVFLVPTAESTNTMAAMTTTSATIDFTADLHSATPVTVGPDAGTYSLDWTAVTQDPQGKPFDFTKASDLFIAHLSTASSITDVEGSLLTSLNASDTWLMDVYGDPAVDDLSQAISPTDGSAFAGFTEDGIWIIGILNPDGSEPAPYLMFQVTVDASATGSDTAAQ